MQQITYNQNFLFPAMYPGYAPPAHQQPISALGLGHLYDMQLHSSWLPFASYIRATIPAHPPIKQEVTVKKEVITPEHSSHATNNSACKYATTTCTANGRGSLPGIDAISQWPSCAQRNTLNSQQSEVQLSQPEPSTNIMPKTTRLSESDTDPLLTSCSRLSTTSSSRQLRLPNVNASSSFAANVMSEESDVGYYSLSDGQSDISLGAPECGFDISTGSDDVFGDVNSKLPEFIDDVLVDICEHDENSRCEDEPVAKRQRHSPPETTSSQKLLPSLQSYRTPHATRVLSNITLNIVNINKNQHSCDVNKPTKHSASQKKDLHCSICFRHFENKTNLKVHLRMHTDIRPHNCSYCDKSFAQKSTLRTHTRTHTGDRPYKCEQCARAFSDYSTYRKHVRVHSGEKPYTCDVCRKSFAQSGNMIRHREIHYRKTSNTTVSSAVNYYR